MKVLFDYLKNKYFGIRFIYLTKKLSSQKLFNPETYNKLLNSKISQGTLHLKNGLIINCYNKHDATIVGETLLFDDYQKKIKITEEDTVFDFGAHIGSFSILAASKGAKVYAFEPDKNNFAKLCENIKINGFEKRIKVFNFGIHYFDTILPLYLSESSGCHSTIVQSGNSVNVGVFCLKTIMEKLGVSKVDFLKIDIEGGEHKLFKHSLDEFKKVSCIVGEYHFGFKEIKKLLRYIYSDVDCYSPYYFYAKGVKA